MIISSKNLEAYIPSLTFPVEILAEKDNRVMFRVDRNQLMALIAKGGVIGIGSRNRIKRLRLNTLIAEQAERIYRESRFGREDLKFTYRESADTQLHTLKRLTEGGHFERWPEDERFAEGRFNPDKIPSPIFSTATLTELPHPATVDSAGGLAGSWSPQGCQPPHFPRDTRTLTTMCPECGSDNVVIKPYDFGTCPQTGYHDAGERFECRDCGATGDGSDLVCDGAAPAVVPDDFRDLTSARRAADRLTALTH